MHIFLEAIIVINAYCPFVALSKKIHITKELTKIDVEKCTSPQDVLVFTAPITVRTLVPMFLFNFIHP